MSERTGLHNKPETSPSKMTKGARSVGTLAAGAVLATTLSGCMGGGPSVEQRAH